MKNSENKNIIILMFILFTIIIGLLIILIYKTNYKKEDNKNTSQTTQNYNLDELNSEKITFINIEEINTYELTMENNLFTKANNESHAYNSLNNNYYIDFIFEDIPFLKIINKKLYWKVNNEWIEDKKITEEIIYANYFAADVTVYKFIIITNSKIYFIEIPNGIETISDILQEKALEDFSKNKYNNLKYEIIKEKVSNIIEKYKPVGCHLTNEIYLLISNKVYFINEESNKLRPTAEKENNFSTIIKEYLGRCGTNDATINIDKNGNIQNDDIDKSKINNIKYYLKNDKFELIVDSNMNYYLTSNNSSNYGKISTLNFNKNNKLLTITTGSKTITLKETSYYLYD